MNTPARSGAGVNSLAHRDAAIHQNAAVVPRQKTMASVRSSNALAVRAGRMGAASLSPLAPLHSPVRARAAAIRRGWASTSH